MYCFGMKHTLPDIILQILRYTLKFRVFPLPLTQILDTDKRKRKIQLATLFLDITKRSFVAAWPFICNLLSQILYDVHKHAPRQMKGRKVVVFYAKAE